MCGRLYLDTMHVDRASWSCDIFQSDGPIWKPKNTVVTIRISRSFLWYAMKELMHVMQEQIDACKAILIFGVHG